MTEPRKISAGEKTFIDQRTRQLMVSWCDSAIRAKTVPLVRLLDDHDVYIKHAIAKGWLSSKSTEHHHETAVYRILSIGWKTATAFLRR